MQTARDAAEARGVRSVTEVYTCETCGSSISPDKAVVVENFPGLSGAGWTVRAHPECVEQARRDLARHRGPLLGALFLSGRREGGRLSEARRG